MRHALWSMGKKLALIGLCILALLLSALFLLPKENRPDSAPLRVGAGDDITGVLLEEIEACARENRKGGLIVSSYIFADCCSSAAQWALQADEIDLGLYCSQAALHMINESNEFEIYGPLILNGEVMAFLDGTEKIQSMGIPRKRSFLGNLVKEAYSDIENITELNRNYSLFTLESGEVDGVVLDAADAKRASEDVCFLPVSKNPYISYCLVVRKRLIGTKEFSDFLSLYEQAAERLNNPDILAERIGMDADFWKMVRTEFLSLS